MLEPKFSNIASKEIFPDTQKILNYYTRGMEQYEVFCNEHFVIKSKKLLHKKNPNFPNLEISAKANLEPQNN